MRNFENMTSFYPKIDDSMLYDGDHCPDVDERYDRDEYIGGASKSSSYSLGPVDNFKLLSQEIDSPKYKIRTQEQQADWSRKNTENKRQMGAYLLYFAHMREHLMEMCTQEKPVPLFGLLEEKPNETRLVEKASFRFDVISMLEEMKDPDLDKNLFQSYVTKISTTYNLNYSKFTKPKVLELLKEFPPISAEYKDYLSKKPEGEMYSLFDDDENMPASIVEFERKSGQPFSIASSFVRNIRILYYSSEGLKERLVCTNLRSCFSIAMKHYHLVGGKKNINFEEKDLISEGATGLMHAVDLYVHGTSARFTTYAENWVRQKVSRYSKNTNTVRVPVHVSDMIYSIRKLCKEHELEQVSLGKRPTELTLERAEELLGKNIEKAIWLLAMNRLNGSSLALSCVTVAGGDDEISFDTMIAGRSESCDMESEHDVDTDKIKAIMEVLKKLRDGHYKEKRPKSRLFITEQQYDFFCKFYIDEMSYDEISKLSIERISEKEVKAEIEKALQNVRAVVSYDDVTS